MTLRIVLADDQALLRGTFRLLVDTERDMEVVAEAGSGREAVELARTHRADVIVMDIRMPESDGLAATRIISADEGLAGVRILVLTTFEEDEFVARALHAGTSGFLGKGIDPAGLLKAIRIVAAGEALLSPAATKAFISRYLTQPTAVIPEHLPTRLATLTPGEREVMTLVATGLAKDEIAEHLFTTPFTVKTHANRSMAEPGARDRAQLVVIAHRPGIASIGPP
ncbi:response regulator [Streptomyces sp. NPDC094038]|uniref:response regulator n=1 Tax=Streptomyces sp. NPDC094038 TaxID=3366055 RepID=UPI0038119DA0